MSKELSEEKSMQFAASFEMFKLALNLIDWEYAEECVAGLREQADWQETMSIFNPGYSLSKNDRIRAQSAALKKFCEGVRLLKDCDEMKQLENENPPFEEIRKRFL